MTLTVQLMMNTFEIGSVYVLFALGLTLIFGVMKIINFAHGELFTFGAIVVTAIVADIGYQGGYSPLDSYLIAFPVAVVSVCILSAILYWGGFSRYLRDLEGSFILSVGMLLLLQGVMLEVFTGAPRTVPKIWSYPIEALGITFDGQRFVICTIAACLPIALYFLVVKTKLGVALRAIAEDREAAMLQGIQYRLYSFYGFMLGALLAAIAGALISPLTAVTPALGSGYLTKAFAIIVIGGLGSIPGAIIAGYLIAAVESVVGYYYDLSVATITMFCLIIVFLLFRPRGLFGHA